MAATETIYQAVGRLLAAGHDPEAAASLALQGMTKAQLIAFVLPEVERLARSVERNRVRRVERRTLPVTGGDTSPDKLKALLVEAFLLPDGELVFWGSATAEQHLARAGWQRRNAAEVLEDAVRHERAAEMIVAAGVSCLDDLDVVAV